MNNKIINDPVIKILLERREEIRKEINKLQEEYMAIGELVSRDQRVRRNKEEEER